MPTSLNCLASASVIGAGSAFSVEASNLRPPFLSISNLSLQVAICAAHQKKSVCHLVSGCKPTGPVAPDPHSLRTWQVQRALRPRPARRMGSQKGLAASWSTWLVSHTPQWLSRVKKFKKWSNEMAQVNSMANGTMTISTSINYALYEIYHLLEIADYCQAICYSVHIRR